MQQWRARYAEVVADLRHSEFTGCSESDLVRAVVNGVGELLELNVTDRALEYLSDKALSEHLAAAITTARTAARGATPAAVDAQSRSRPEPPLRAARVTVSTTATATDPDQLCTVRADATGNLLAVDLSDDAYDLAGDELAEAVNLAASAAHRMAASSGSHRSPAP